MIENNKVKRYIQKAIGGVVATILGAALATHLTPSTVKAYTPTQLNLHNNDPHTFIEHIGPAASTIANENGLYASVMIAQAILESDFGRSDLASPPTHNLFGIKGTYHGHSVVMPTFEFLGGYYVQIDDQFRSYPGYYSSLLNNASVLRSGNAWDSQYYEGAWVENTLSYQDATAWLENRYATDPTYASKLNSLIERYELTRFDSATQTSTTSNKAVNISIQPVVENTKSATHHVTVGDTLYNISNRYGLSVSELQGINGKSSEIIEIGETLNVSDGSAQAPIEDNGSEHIVQIGDTLYNISNRYGLTVNQLQQMNQLTSTNIQIGQRLFINGSSTPTQRKHIVQSGDTLYNVASRYGVSVQGLKNVNNLQSNHIQVGQELWY